VSSQPADLPQGQASVELVPAASSEPAAAATPAASESRPSRADAARSSGYRSRFALIYVALAVLAGVGVGAFAILLTKPDAAPAPAWSAWAPSGSDLAKTKQIADRVSKGYRDDIGDQLVIALSGPPTVTAGSSEGTGDIPVRAIAIRPDTSTGQAEEDDVAIVDSASSHQYILCGLGANCSISSGAPSEERHALLRREAVELALYTFKYVPSVDSVTVFLPPRPDAAAAPTAVFLRRGDVEPELRKPLRDTLEPTTPTIGQLQGQELAAVNRVTRPRLYQYEYTQAQDGSAVLVLNPIVTTG
jgi:hypothetical protein